MLPSVTAIILLCWQDSQMKLHMTITATWVLMVVAEMHMKGLNYARELLNSLLLRSTWLDYWQPTFV